MSRTAAIAAPLLLAEAFLIQVWGQTQDEPSALLRPAAVVGLAVVVLTITLMVIIRSRGIATLAACLVVAALADLWIGLGVALAASAILIQRHLCQRRWPIRSVHALGPTGLLLAVSVLWTNLIGTVAAEVVIASPPSALAHDQAGRPNVYLLLLDGYPRQDTLATVYDFDNDAFLGELEALGFSVNGEATSAFHNTELSLASMQRTSPDELAAYYRQGVNGPVPSVSRRTVNRELLADSPVMSDLRSVGYRLVYVPPAIGFVTWSGWDEVRGSAHLTDFESKLVQRTPMRWLLGEWVLDQARDRNEASLASWSQSATRQSLVFAHLIAPHPPFQWNSKGETADVLPCWYEDECTLYSGPLARLGLSRSMYADLMRGQIEGLNERVLAAVRRLVETDPSAVIAIFSDHGTRIDGDDSPEAHRTLFLARGTDAGSIDGLLPSLLDERGQ